MTSLQRMRQLCWAAALVAAPRTSTRISNPASKPRVAARFFSAKSQGPDDAQDAGLASPAEPIRGALKNTTAATAEAADDDSISRSTASDDPLRRPLYCWRVRQRLQTQKHLLRAAASSIQVVSRAESLIRPLETGDSTGTTESPQQFGSQESEVQNSNHPNTYESEGTLMHALALYRKPAFPGFYQILQIPDGIVFQFLLGLKSNGQEVVAGFLTREDPEEASASTIFGKLEKPLSRGVGNSSSLAGSAKRGLSHVMPPQESTTLRCDAGRIDDVEQLHRIGTLLSMVSFTPHVNVPGGQLIVMPFQRVQRNSLPSTEAMESPLNQSCSRSSNGAADTPSSHIALADSQAGLSGPTLHGAAKMKALSPYPSQATEVSGSCPESARDDLAEAKKAGVITAEEEDSTAVQDVVTDNANPAIFQSKELVSSDASEIPTNFLHTATSQKKVENPNSCTSPVVSTSTTLATRGRRGWRVDRQVEQLLERSRRNSVIKASSAAKADENSSRNSHEAVASSNSSVSESATQPEAESNGDTEINTSYRENSVSGFPETANPTTATAAAAAATAAKLAAVLSAHSLTGLGPAAPSQFSIGETTRLLSEAAASGSASAMDVPGSSSPKSPFNSDPSIGNTLPNFSGDEPHGGAAGEDREEMTREASHLVVLPRVLVTPCAMPRDIQISERQPNDMVRVYHTEIVACVRQLLRSSFYYKDNFEQVVRFYNLDYSGRLADLIASMSFAKRDELQAVLEELDLEKRLALVLEISKKDLEFSKLQNQLKLEVEEKMAKDQKKYILNEQLKFIKKELGLDRDDRQMVIDDLVRATANKVIPPMAQKVIDQELGRLSTLEPASSEFNVCRVYLEWVCNMPWGIRSSTESHDITAAALELDKHHFGLKEIKERLLEFIAVGILRKKPQGKVLCLVGPPGVGKTSIGRSIAKAVNREFFSFSLGGLTDVSELRGHRRTYLGALPGKIVQALRHTGTSNPVILLDEIDKLGRDVRGDPAAALLEILDPTQNSCFRDLYLDLPLDLSSVLFVCTANTTDSIPPALLDRMEILRLAGYVLAEKIEILKRCLLPRVLEESGVASSIVRFEEEAIRMLASHYSREAGVRNLLKTTEKILRKLALNIVKSQQDATTAAAAVASKSLVAIGDPAAAKKPSDLGSATAEPGVAGINNGLSDNSSVTSPAGSLPSTDDLVPEGEQEQHRGLLTDTKYSSNGVSREDQQPVQQHEHQSPTEAEQPQKPIDPAATHVTHASLAIPPPPGFVVSLENLQQYVGLPQFRGELLYAAPAVGVMTGLAWTANGGAVLFIEAKGRLVNKAENESETDDDSEDSDNDADAGDDSCSEVHAASVLEHLMPPCAAKYEAPLKKDMIGPPTLYQPRPRGVTKKKKSRSASTASRNTSACRPGSFRVTGHLGTVMSESCQLALSFARFFMAENFPNNTFLDDAYIHVHVPEGATPKDGPSAGITIAAALVSLALNCTPIPSIAMTGEITLTGKVLRIGGVNEKLIASQRENVRNIMLPLDNKPDFDELPSNSKEQITVYFVDNFCDVFSILFPDQPRPKYPFQGRPMQKIFIPRTPASPPVEEAVSSNPVAQPSKDISNDTQNPPRESPVETPRESPLDIPRDVPSEQPRETTLETNVGGSKKNGDSTSPICPDSSKTREPESS